MKKYITDFTVVSNTALTERLFLLVIAPSDGAPIAVCRPGQFVEVRVDDEPHVLLRRPISIHRIDRSRNHMWLLIQKAGAGTLRLAHLEAGRTINLVYPLGNGFTLDGAAQRYLLIGGGVGVAPLLEAGASLNANGREVTFLLGVRTAGDLVERDEWTRYGTLLVTTEDGSLLEGFDCQPGFVTQHSALREDVYDAVRVCGPGPMMRAVAQTVSRWTRNAEAHYCEVSLENKMACGLGACLCCVEDTREGHKCVCTDGPVFDIKDLRWG